jgi:hypothetical protein
MLNKKKRYRLLLSCILFLLLFGLSVYNRNYFKENLSAVSIRYNVDSVSVKDIKKVIQNQKNNGETNIPRFTLWKRNQKQTIHNKVTGLSQETNVIEMYGNMAQIIPMTLLEGNYVFVNDPDGCVLDSKTAYQLFGTPKAVNNRVLWNGKEYIVRGVVKAADTMMIIQTTDNDRLFSNLEAVYAHQAQTYRVDNERQQLKNTLYESGLKTPDAVMDGLQFLWMLTIICRFPVWLIAFTTILLLIRHTNQLRNNQFQLLLHGVGIVILILFLVKITKLSIYIPDSFIPTKWSDFDFYVDKYKEIKENMVQIHNCIWMPKDYQRNNVFHSGVILVLWNILVLIYACIHAKIYPTKAC